MLPSVLRQDHQAAGERFGVRGPANHVALPGLRAIGLVGQGPGAGHSSDPAVGAAARTTLPPAIAALGQTAGRLIGEERDRAGQLLAAARHRLENLGKFVAADRRFCWPVPSLTDVKLVPFHRLASEGHVHPDRGHAWHIERKASAGKAELSARDGEGILVKLPDFVLRGERGLAQPAIKGRGGEYLRIIYGPD